MCFTNIWNLILHLISFILSHINPIKTIMMTCCGIIITESSQDSYQIARGKLNQSIYLSTHIMLDTSNFIKENPRLIS